MIAFGETLQGRYTIVRLLGTGGMASVYEATDRRLRMQVALKHVVVDTPQQRRLFEREALLVAPLRHPALPIVYDYFVENDQAYLVMELIHGSDLGAQLAARGRAFPADQVLRWADELLDALVYLHSQRPPLIHRDIKPQNLKLRADGGVMLLDFGLAKGAYSASRSVAPSVFGYTLQYAPPEQIRDEGTDARSDLFALAMTLYELFTVRRPPDALERALVLGRGAADPLRALQSYAPHLPTEIHTALQAALALEPEHRPAHATLLRESLRDIVVVADNDARENMSVFTAVDPAISSFATALPAPSLPTGTVTFLFAKRINEEVYLHQASSKHLCMALQRSGGAIFHDDGTTISAAFGAANDALMAALLVARRAGSMQPVETIRIALHSGIAQERDGGYAGPPVERTTRLLEVCHNGQIVLSRAVGELVSDHLPLDVSLRDLGSYRLRGMLRPEEIFQVVAPGLPTDFPAPSVAGSYTNLPIQPTALIGREREVAAVSALVRHAEGRLVTLIGTGGTGKTRLAIEVASELSAEFAHGVAFVSLASVADASLVLAAIGQVLGVREYHGTIGDAISAYLREKQMLLLLDNCEHVLDAAPELAALLTACPRLTMLATSRELLRIEGEERFAVPPLTLPHASLAATDSQLIDLLSESSAVTLFVERARAAQPGFVLAHTTAGAVAEICRRLDGLPLAIELAAARVRLFTPEALLTRLSDAHHDTSLRLLTGVSNQRTLRDAISWSYDLLDAAEQTLFRQLALFAGGATLEAVESVVELPADERRSHLDLLISLIDKSLLRQEQQSDGEPRFVLLETIRAYARDRLNAAGEVEACADRHASTYLQLAERAEPTLRGPDQLIWLERLERDIDNLRAALDWSLTTQRSNTLQLASALGQFWVRRGYLREGASWLRRALNTDQHSMPATRAKALARSGDLAFHQSNLEGSKVFYQAALSLYQGMNDHLGEAWMQYSLGRAYRDYSDALSCYNKSLSLFHTMDNPVGCAAVLNEMGSIKRWQGDYTSARRYHDESIALFTDVGDLSGKAEALIYRGHLAATEGAYNEAQAFLNDGLHLSRMLGDRIAVCFALQALATIESHRGQFGTAHTLFIENMDLWREVGDQAGLAWSLYDQGRCFVRQGDAASARESLARSLDLFRAQLDPWGTAWVQTMLGYAAYLSGDRVSASKHWLESLAHHHASGTKDGVICVLEGFATLLLGLGQTSQAMTVASAARTARITIPIAMPPADQPFYDVMLTTARAQIGDASFQAAWESGSTMSLDQACAVVQELTLL